MACPEPDRAVIGSERSPTPPAIEAAWTRTKNLVAVDTTQPRWLLRNVAT